MPIPYTYHVRSDNTSREIFTNLTNDFAPKLSRTISKWGKKKTKNSSADKQDHKIHTALTWRNATDRIRVISTLSKCTLAR